MSATPEPAKCNSKNCNDPPATGKASCARHLKAASDRMTRLREERKAAAQKSKTSTSMMLQDHFQGNDASQTRPALQVISVNGNGAIPAKRKRPENDSSSEEEVSLASAKDQTSERVYENQEQLLQDLCHRYKQSKGVLKFLGAYNVPAGGVDDFSIEKRNSIDKSTVEALADSIWDATKRRWRSKDIKYQSHGLKSRWFCCQDIDQQVARKRTKDDSKKNRDRLPMQAFECKSRLTIRVILSDDATQRVSIQLVHRIGHRAYYDIALPPEAQNIIAESLWSTPSDIAKRIRKNNEWGHIKTYQVRHVWKQLCQDCWRLCDDQVESAKRLLEKHGETVELFEMESIPDVTALAFGVIDVAARLRDVVEVAMDATYNTNAADLELYVLMAEHDNTGMPIAYLFLSTATSIEKQKRRRALKSFLEIIKIKYGTSPRFVHTDKDTAEIGAVHDVWKDAKHQLCQWHVERAIGDRIKKKALATTKYDVKRARKVFSFIGIKFVPRVKSDPNDHEGVKHTRPKAPLSIPSTQFLILQHPNANPNAIPPLRLPPRPPGAPVPKPTINVDDYDENDDEDEASVEDESPDEERLFCPEQYRKPLLTMIKKHANAHPLIPGDCDATPEAIYYWATRKAYDFCLEKDLPELWAYLWENWYSPGRWELWTRSPYSEIPILRTTMICESHWKLLKENWLHLWPKMRLDLLVWIMVDQIVPHYAAKMKLILEPSGRARDRADWRDELKREWRLCEEKETSPPDEFPYLKYAPNPRTWTCSCPAFLISRFLICKHLIQLCHPVPATFFHEVKRNRTLPFWSHATLVPLTPLDGDNQAMILPFTGTLPGDYDGAIHDDYDDSPAPELVASFAPELTAMANKLKDTANFLLHQIQFGQVRFLPYARRKLTPALDFHTEIKQFEDTNNAPHAKRPNTWRRNNFMFAYSRSSDAP